MTVADPLRRDDSLKGMVFAEGVDSGCYVEGGALGYYGTDDLLLLPLALL